MHENSIPSHNKYERSVDMSKGNGFSSFTPAQDAEFIKQQQKTQPQDPHAGEQRHKQKQKAVNKYNK